MHRPHSASPVTPAGRALLAAAIVTASLLAGGAATADTRLFRPLTADPRESQSRWRMSEYTEDQRYGSDIADSTTRGGVLPDVKGVGWEIAGGEVFRWRPLERLLGWRGPWVRYQLGVPGAMFVQFDRGGIHMNSDFQYGGSFDVLWRGDYDATRGITGFGSAVITSRLALLHRSSHLGDEYLAFGAFGRNRPATVAAPRLFEHPPVKRAELTQEVVTAVVSMERSAGNGGATLRAYAGGEFKLRFPSSWGIGGLFPAAMTSPAWRGGLEYRSAGDSPDPPDTRLTELIDGVLRRPGLETEWFAAVDARVAKPFRFAASDNPNGDDELWTPYLWTFGHYGREFDAAATSWRAMVGLSLSSSARRNAMLGGGRVGPEWIVALEWYRGFSPNGQFLDQRMRYAPRWGVLPSVTAHF